MPSTDLWAGLGGIRQNACVALCTNDEILGICEQERITRVRAAGFNQTGLPDEAFDELLRRAGRERRELTGYAFGGDVAPSADLDFVPVGDHFAHACSAYLSSPFESATIVVCDLEAPQVSVWDGDSGTVSRVDWPWEGIGFAGLYARCAEALGFTSQGREQRMEALARLNPTPADRAARALFSLEPTHLRLTPGWHSTVQECAARNRHYESASIIAARLQSRIGELLIDFLSEVRRRVPRGRLCVGGSLFQNSYFNAQVKLHSAFEDVFVPISPGNAGNAVGAAFHASGLRRQPVTPFLGPAYRSEEIKATLDNCKLTYIWASESDTIAMTVAALQKGQIVGWFDGRMEWGPRALGARSIIANPFAPYVLENLNRFLKQRDAWRGYAVSAIDAAVHVHFDGPRVSPFMDSDYVPRDRFRFRHILPGPHAAVRVHTVDPAAPPRFRALLQAFGDAAGVPVLVNTSFNGFREPIVCSPRDAVRVFFGSGIDMLVLDQFIISK